MDMMLRALADGTRRQILALVWREERTAGDIAAEFAMTRPAVSQHLTILRESELVFVRHEGTRRLYRANRQAVARLRAELGAFWGRPSCAAQGRGRAKGQAPMNDEGGVIEREIFIAAMPEVVFDFLIDPALMAQWIGLFHKLEARPGGLFQVEVSRGNVARGVYTEVTPPRRVAFTWGWDSQDPTLAMLPPGTSLVEIELESKDGGTLLRLRHSRLPEPTSIIHGERWSAYLGRLEVVARQGSRGRARR